MIRRHIAAVFGRPLGVLLGTLYYCYLRLRNVGRVPVVLRSGGVTSRWYRRARGLPRGIAAITFGPRVFTNRRFIIESWLLLHETQHVRQYASLGWCGFLARYGQEIVLYGYDNAPLEWEARDAASSLPY